MKSFTLILCFFISTYVLAQNENSSESDQIVEQLREALYDAAKDSYQSHVDMRLAALAAEFDLSDEQLKKARLFSKKVASDQAKECQSHLDNFLNQAIRDPSFDVLDCTFSINGKTVGAEGGSRSLAFNVDAPKRWVSKRSSGMGGGSWMDMHSPIDFSVTVWQKPFSGVLEQKQLEGYQQKFDDWERRQMARASVSLASDFRFSNDQKIKLVDGIAGAMVTNNQSTIGELNQSFKRLQVTENLDLKLLTPAQRAVVVHTSRRFGSEEAGEKSVQKIERKDLAGEVDKILRQSISQIVKSGFDIELDQFSQVLDIDGQAKARLQDVVNQISKQVSQGIFEDSKTQFASLENLFEPNSTGFVWGEKRFEVKEADGDEKPTGGEVTTLFLRQTDSRFNLLAVTGFARSNFNFRSKNSSGKQHLADFDIWNAEVEKLGEKLKSRWVAFENEQTKQSSIDAAVAALAVDLVLSESQMEKLAERLDKSSPDWLVAGSTVIYNAKQAILALEDLEFLTDAQRVYLGIVTFRLR